MILLHRRLTRLLVPMYEPHLVNFGQLIPKGQRLLIGLR